MIVEPLDPAERDGRLRCAADLHWEGGEAVISVTVPSPAAAPPRTPRAGCV